MRPTIAQLNTIVQIFNAEKRKAKLQFGKGRRRAEHNVDEAAKMVAEDILKIVRGEKLSFDMDIASNYLACKEDLAELLNTQDERIRIMFDREFTARTGLMIDIR